MAEETPLFFGCRDESLFGILHDSAGRDPTRGLVVVVGGPQYRVGSHRQFVLLARAVADAGFPVLRFDYRGMGDSTGPSVGFEDVGPDIEAAVGQLCQRYPSLESVTLWGLCDAASAALFYAGGDRDPRVDTLVLLNPWVRTEAGAARAQASGYYGKRLTSMSAWLDLLRSPARMLRVAGNLLRIARRAANRSERAPDSLPERVLSAIDRFDGDALLVISGDDLTAREFLDVAVGDRRFLRALDTGRMTRFDIEAADHTFSTESWRRAVEHQTIEWLRR